MKTTTLFFKALFICSLAIGFVACSDEDDDAPNNPNPDQTAAVPQFAGSEATLVAIKTRTTTDTPIGPIGIDLGTAVAVFYQDGGNSFINVGAVSCEEVQLNRFDNNAYVYTPGATEPAGIDFGNSVAWEVEGGSGFPAMSTASQLGFPQMGDITSAATVTKANGYTITLDGIAAADSVVYSIGSVNKTLVGSAASCAFTAAELANVNAGVSIVQAAAYRFSSEDVQGKEVYFVNQFVTTKTVEVQ